MHALSPPAGGDPALPVVYATTADRPGEDARLSARPIAMRCRAARYGFGVHGSLETHSAK
ncbi:hypothetical protein GCM10010345_70970 [Streptomyces canarius]|uniref:Uncharacterized protein n=1 Tax=Streptomyces canarius TaxID=285453 RepID=A0ABQ3D5X6_9ACTN|nr:hypothetical protein GCM10010345_70970 [Streptomyces canarius]